MTRTDTVVIRDAATHAGARNIKPWPLRIAAKRTNASGTCGAFVAVFGNHGCRHQDRTLENVERNETNHVQYAWINITERIASHLKPRLTDLETYLKRYLPKTVGVSLPRATLPK